MDAQAETGLLLRARQGDETAFDALVEAYFDRIYNFNLRYLGQPDAAADVTQETFLRAWRSLRKWRAESAFTTWLYSIALNVCKSHLRKHSRFPRANPSMENDPLERLSDEAQGPDSQVLRQERSEAVLQAILRLPPDMRAVLVLRDLQQASYEEIGEVLGLKLGTVKSRLNRARLALRTLLEAQRELFDSLVGPIGEAEREEQV